MYCSKNGHQQLTVYGGSTIVYIKPERKTKRIYYFDDQLFLLPIYLEKVKHLTSTKHSTRQKPDIHATTITFITFNVKFIHY